MLTAGAKQPLTVTFTPFDSNYQSATATVLLNVTATTAGIVWNVPAPIVYGTPLGAAQLTASSGVAGTFVYSPPAGTVLNAGVRTLSVTFTPSDTLGFAVATATVPLIVLKASPVISWPRRQTSSSARSGRAVERNRQRAGTFVYTPPAGTVLPLGPAQRLSVVFTPTDTANYKTMRSAMPITVVTAAERRHRFGSAPGSRGPSRTRRSLGAVAPCICTQCRRLVVLHTVVGA